MSTSSLEGTVAEAVTALHELASDPERCGELDPHLLQGLLSAATRMYAVRRQAGEDIDPFAADGAGEPPTATEVAIVVTEMLESASIEVFELGLWQTWSTTNRPRSETNG